jgi:hypothetical protein
MAIRLISIPPGMVSFDADRFPETTGSWVFDHLLHYCSLLDTLPAIQVLVMPTDVVATRGQVYLRIARILERPNIRAVLQPASDPDSVAALMRAEGVDELDWREIDADERARPIVDQWHVFYFSTPLTRREKTLFDRDVAGFFTSLGTARELGSDMTLVGEVTHDDESMRAQFLARVPVSDESWYAPYLGTIRRFSEDHVQVISHQGMRFGS